MCACTCAQHAFINIWKPEDNYLESALFLPENPKKHTHIIRFGGKHPYTWKHVTSPPCLPFWMLDLARYPRLTLNSWPSCLWASCTCPEGPHHSFRVDFYVLGLVWLVWLGLFVCVLLLLLLFETVSYYVAQAGHKLESLLPLLPECWDYRSVTAYGFAMLTTISSPNEAMWQTPGSPSDIFLCYFHIFPYHILS